MAQAVQGTVGRTLVVQGVVGPVLVCLGSASGERGVLHPVLHLLHPAFLQLQVHDGGLKDGLTQQGDISGSVAEILVKAGYKSAKHELVVNFRANVTKFII